MLLAFLSIIPNYNCAGIGSVLPITLIKQNVLESLIFPKKDAPGNDTCNGNGSNDDVSNICAKVGIDIDSDNCTYACKDDKDCQADVIQILIKLLLKLSSYPVDKWDLVDICLIIQLDNILNKHCGNDVPVLLKLVIDLVAKAIVKVKVELS